VSRHMAKWSVERARPFGWPDEGTRPRASGPLCALAEGSGMQGFKLDEGIR